MHQQLSPTHRVLSYLDLHSPTEGLSACRANTLPIFVKFIPMYLSFCSQSLELKLLLLK